MNLVEFHYNLSRAKDDRTGHLLALADLLEEADLTACAVFARVSISQPPTPYTTILATHRSKRDNRSIYPLTAGGMAVRCYVRQMMMRDVTFVGLELLCNKLSPYYLREHIHPSILVRAGYPSMDDAASQFCLLAEEINSPK